MHAFETTVDFIDEERACRVEWDWADDQVWVQKVWIAMILEHHWTPSGECKHWIDLVEVEVKDILSGDQISDFARQIKADQVQRATEDYDDGRMLDWEEKNLRLRAA